VPAYEAGDVSAALPAEDAAPPVASNSERAKQREAELQAEKTRLLQDLPDADIGLIDGYLENAADENTTKRISLGREVTIIGELAALYRDLGVESWRYGVTQANMHRVPNANYVKKAASKHSQQTRASPGGMTDTERRARRTHSDWENWESPDEHCSGTAIED